MTLVRTVPTAEGKSLGKEHARFYELELSKRPRELDDRCSTCACRLGTLPNGAPQTQMDLVKCIMDGVDFMCHEKGREGVLCHGYKMLKRPEGQQPKKMPWPFSDEPENP